MRLICGASLIQVWCWSRHDRQRHVALAFVCRSELHSVESVEAMRGHSATTRFRTVPPQGPRLMCHRLGAWHARLWDSGTSVRGFPCLGHGVLCTHHRQRRALCYVCTAWRSADPRVSRVNLQASRGEPGQGGEEGHTNVKVGKCSSEGTTTSSNTSV